MSPEFLTRVELTAPPGIDPQLLLKLRQQEAQRAHELAASGNLVRLWRTKTEWGNWGLWSCSGRDELERLLDDLPLRQFMVIEIHDLGLHPSDPQDQRAREEEHRDV